MSLKKYLGAFARRLIGQPRESEWAIRMRRENLAFQKILARCLRPDSNCVDVGCNRGEWLQFYQRYAPDGSHHAFEPLPQLAENLRANFPLVTVHQCALSDQSGTASFFFARELDGWSGLRRQHYPGGVSAEETVCATEKLDDVIPHATKIDFIKIDVEGAEHLVLRGARELIRRWRPTIVFEYAIVHAREFNILPAAFFRVLYDECGLNIFTLEGSRPLTAVEFTALCEYAHTTAYGRDCEGNFLAVPR